jgi:hypothetical protein
VVAGEGERLKIEEWWSRARPEDGVGWYLPQIVTKIVFH